MTMINQHKPKGDSLYFMGEHFEDRNARGKVYPAFTGDDAIRAIRAGATTPHDVEMYVYTHSAAYKRKQLAAARANGKKIQPVVSTKKRIQKQRVAGSAKGGATMRRRKAA